jgi:hypothetical protein
MRFACIKDGKVQNIIVAEEDIVSRIQTEFGYDSLVRYDDKPIAEQPHLGDSYDGSVFTRAEAAPIPQLTQWKDESGLTWRRLPDGSVIQISKDPNGALWAFKDNAWVRLAALMSGTPIALGIDRTEESILMAQEKSEIETLEELKSFIADHMGEGE